MIDGLDGEQSIGPLVGVDSTSEDSLRDQRTDQTKDGNGERVPEQRRLAYGRIAGSDSVANPRMITAFEPAMS